MSSPSLQIGQKLNESIWIKLCDLVPNVFTVSRGVASDVKILIPGVWNTAEVPYNVNFLKKWSNQLAILQ